MLTSHPKNHNVDHTREVDMVVDGVAMGHKLCAMQLCPNPPSDFCSRKLCAEHQLSHGHLCGIEGCEQPIAEDPPNTRACSLAAHQEQSHLQNLTNLSKCLRIT